MAEGEVTDVEIEAAVNLAEHCETLAAVGKAVNEALDLDWSDAKWRGKWKHNPRETEMVRKQLGKARHRIEQTIRLTGNQRGAVASDFHAPYHDYLAVLLLCKVLAWWQPDLFVIDGDGLDFYALSAYDKNPERAYGLQAEIDAFHTDVLAPIVAALPSKGTRIFTPGNHEDRLRRFLWRNPDLYGVRSLQLPSLLELDRFGFKYAEQAIYVDDILEITHGEKVSKWSAYASKAESEARRYSITTITGHVHKAGHFGTTVPGTQRQYVSGYSNPCMCRLNPEYMRNPDWVQGFTLFDVRDGNLAVEQVIINPNYTCMAGGKWFGVE